jgi:ribosome silencing factor RsfS/YbeB/iojap
MSLSLIRRSAPSIRLAVANSGSASKRSFASASDGSRGRAGASSTAAASASMAQVQKLLDEAQKKAADDMKSQVESLRNRRDALQQEQVLEPAQVVKFLTDRRFDDVEVVDVSEKCSWTNAMVFATGKTARQMLAAANLLVKEFREIIPTCREDRAVIESDDKWVVIDCGLVVVHLFSAEGRRLYKLDTIWKERPTLAQLSTLPDTDALDDTQFDELDNLVDDDVTETYIAASLEESRLDPADFGASGTAAALTGAVPLARGRLAARKHRK